MARLHAVLFGFVALLLPPRVPPRASVRLQQVQDAPAPPPEDDASDAYVPDARRVAADRERTLAALRCDLEALIAVKEPKPLLPSVGEVDPRAWVPALALPLALRDGKEPIAATRHALASARFASSTPGSCVALPAKARLGWTSEGRHW